MQDDISSMALDHEIDERIRNGWGEKIEFETNKQAYWEWCDANEDDGMGFTDFVDNVLPTIRKLREL